MTESGDEPLLRATLRGRRPKHSLASRVWSALVSAVRMAMIIVMAIGTLVIAGVGVINVIDSREPSYWGTFAESHCEPRFNRPCRSVGTWVSDDGSISKSGIYLDGRVGSDRRTPALYRPTGILNDDDNNIVHTRSSVTLSYFFPWVMTLAGGWLTVHYWREWWSKRSESKTLHFRV